jgi:hypothetical protein
MVNTMLRWSGEGERTASPAILSSLLQHVVLRRRGMLRLHSWLSCPDRSWVAHAGGTSRNQDGKAQRAELSFDVSPPLAICVFVIGAAARTRVRFDEVAVRMDDMLLPFAFWPRFCRYLLQRDSGFTVLFHQFYHVSQANCMVLKHELWFSAWEPRTVGFLLHSFFA